MKKSILLFFSCFFLVSIMHSQGKRDSVLLKNELMHPNVQLPCSDCTPTASPNANLVLNPSLLPNASFPGTIAAEEDPLASCYIDNWRKSHGSPDNYGLYGPLPGTSSLEMACSAMSSEGSCGRLQPLIAGHHYILTFYWRTITLLNGDPTDDDYSFNIYLMNCSDGATYFTNTNAYYYPPIPPNSQKIFCAHNYESSDFQQQTISFIADDNYDMMWLFPKQNNIATMDYQHMGFAYPQLIDQDAFSINITSDLLNPCIKTLSPSIVIPNATYEWSLNGTVFSTLQNPQLDATTQYGNLYLYVTIPNGPINNICSGNGAGLEAAAQLTPSCALPIDDQVWTWMGGDNTMNQRGVYGFQGIENSANKPGARTLGMSWTDLSGNLWLFGGVTVEPPVVLPDGSSSGLVNDLWKYDMTTHQWTWKKGSNICGQPAVYGIQGVANNANTPGARTNAATWMDPSGNFLWLYGGSTDLYASDNNTLSDLWKYNINNNQWTWVSGSKFPGLIPAYGTQGISSPLNNPGSRTASTSWVDADGHFWLYGGYSNRQHFGDLWKYDGQWTWVSGNNETHPVYGIKKVEASSNTPGLRDNSIGLADGSNNLWLFGGRFTDRVTLSNGSYNDLWKFNINSGKWTWVSGDNTVDQRAVYGTKGVGDPANKPGANTGDISWIDIPKGNLWLFGSTNSDAIWKYSISSDEWTWVGGNNALTIANYGILGVSAYRNTPGTRSGSFGWREPSTGSIWLFGGGGVNSATISQTRSGSFNDLWKYNNPSTGQCCQYRMGEFPIQASFLRSPNILITAGEPNPQKNTIQETVIQSVEIYNSIGQLIQRLDKNDQIIHSILNYGKSNGIKPGLYFLRIYYKDKTVATVKRLLQ